MSQVMEAFSASLERPLYCLLDFISKEFFYLVELLTFSEEIKDQIKSKSETSPTESISVVAVFFTFSSLECMSFQLKEPEEKMIITKKFVN